MPTTSLTSARAEAKPPQYLAPPVVVVIREHVDDVTTDRDGRCFLDGRDLSRQYRLTGERGGSGPARSSSGARGAAALLCAVATLTPAAVAADANEASVHGQALVGIVRTSDHEAVGTGPLIGGSLRATVARSDRWAFELTLAGFQAALRHDDAVESLGGVPLHGVIERTQLGGRAELGVHARLGVRWIPTVHVGVGLQVRHLTATTLRGDAGMALATIPATDALDVTAALGLGIDRRLGRSLVLGVNLAAVHAQPLGGEAGAMTSAEATLHVA